MLVKYTKEQKKYLKDKRMNNFSNHTMWEPSIKKCGDFIIVESKMNNPKFKIN